MGRSVKCAWILALLVFGYIVAVARTRDQFPWGI